MQRAIGDVYRDLDLSMESWPTEDEPRDPAAYKEALDSFDPGDACTVFTPDDTHFDIAMEAVKRGIHAIVTKPVVKTLKDHRLLHEAAKKAGVLVMVEVHKRFDPIYIDARDRIRDLGGMSYMYSYMSQPKVCVCLLTSRGRDGLRCVKDLFLFFLKVRFDILYIHLLFSSLAREIRAAWKVENGAPMVNALNNHLPVFTGCIDIAIISVRCCPF